MKEYERLRNRDFGSRAGMILSHWDRFGLFMRVKHETLERTGRWEGGKP